MLSIASIHSLRRRRALDVYRATGHRHAHLYPIFFGEREGGSRSLDDLARRAFADDQQEDIDDPTVHAFRRQLELTYCDSVGIDASALEHLCVADDADAAARRAFLFEHAEQRAVHDVVIDDEHVARVLHAADTFDKWMQRDDRAFRKQYSCEGVTGFLAAVWAAMAAGASDGARHIVMSLTHRSRAQTMLALGVPPDELMRKFLGGGEFDVGAWPEACGDLLYNLPARGQVVFIDGNAVHVDVPPNPCHLELVVPACLGLVRAAQDQLVSAGASEVEARLCVMPVLVHGDGALAGQGVVAEAMNLSQLPDFRVGGAVHVVLSNQINVGTGATECRSTPHACDVLRAYGAPVIHVNACDARALAWAGDVAAKYRARFGSDIVINVCGYRRRGHNEMMSEDPVLTHPRLYACMDAVDDVVTRANRERDAETVARERDETEAMLNAAWLRAKASLQVPRGSPSFGAPWSDLPLRAPRDDARVPTGVARDAFFDALALAHALPPAFVAHDRVRTAFDERRSRHGAVSFAAAEAVALATLAREGNAVRVCGQDSARGVYIERFGRIVCQHSGAAHSPLAALGVSYVNSPLTENAVLGFEFGMTWYSPDRLNVWEAQLGDYFNNAQAVIDGFVSACRERWMWPSALVLLLPHGFVGAGAEHSSARVDRFLAMSSEPIDMRAALTCDVNWHIVHPSTSAQYFHALRRQLQRKSRKPLIVLGPKRQQREALALSPIEAMLDDTRFECVIDDGAFVGVAAVVVLCSGQTYFDAVRVRAEAQRISDMALVRVEELCPFPFAALDAVLRRYPAEARVVWLQEEGQNGGAFAYMVPRVEQLIGSRRLGFVGRAASAAPATGMFDQHVAEVNAIKSALASV